MRADAVEMIVTAINRESDNFRVQSHGRWAVMSCPLAPWQHPSGHDSKPSFSISVEEGRSWCKCFGCGFTGSMRDLLNAAEGYGAISTGDAVELRYYVAMEEAKHYKLLEDRGIRPELDQDLIRSFNKPHPYWEERGYDDALRADWGLGFSPEENRAMIPFFDMNGELIGAVGRAMGKELPKYRVYPEGVDRSSFLFGEHRVTGEETAILLVEGYLDTVSASKYLPAGMGVLGLGSASPSEAQIRRLMMFSNEVIVGLDNDQAGIIGKMKTLRLIGQRARVSEITYEGVKDADEAGARLPEFVGKRTPLLLSRLENALQPSLNK